MSPNGDGEAGPGAAANAPSGGAIGSTGYAVRYGIEYPDRQLNRLTSFFRIIVIIPIAIVLWSIVGFTGGWGADSNEATTITVGGAGLLFFPPLLMILFRKKYPRWWFDWNRELFRFGNRVGLYLALMDDRYPSTDEQQSLRLEIDYPDAEQDLMRGMPLVKWILAIPHYIILFFLWIAAVFAVIFSWFAILFTGRYPRSLFDFVQGVLRWHARVMGYMYLLVTDRYPPFSLSD